MLNGHLQRDDSCHEPTVIFLSGRHCYLGIPSVGCTNLISIWILFVNTRFFLLEEIQSELLLLLLLLFLLCMYVCMYVCISMNLHRFKSVLKVNGGQHRV